MLPHHPELVFLHTKTVVYWLPVFVSAEPCLICTESLNYCYQHKGLRINAFVIMLTHTHLIVFDAEFDNERLNKTITAMRQYTGRQLANYCHEKMPAIYGQVLVHHAAKIERINFGSKASTQWRFGQRGSGERSLIICMSIHVARGWCERR